MSGEALAFKPKGPRTKDGDGDDTEIIELSSVNITKIANGWIIGTEYDDDEPVVEVFNNVEQEDGNRKTVQAIIESLGLDSEVFLK